MIRGIEGVLVGSQNAQKLADFYEKTVGLKLTNEFEMGENNEKGFEFTVKGSSGLYIMDHSEVKGKNKNPERVILNFEVNDIEKEVARLKKAKVKIQQDIYHIEGYGLIATFVDPDGNFFQFVQVRASN
ncbi:MAG: VOC family protein [Candidatus Levybacteria bacterium]|nr:VOC family protein [Candidatus Levybacteria bacterium]